MYTGAVHVPVPYIALANNERYLSVVKHLKPCFGCSNNASFRVVCICTNGPASWGFSRSAGLFSTVAEQ